MALIGLGFNVKMLAAFVVLPTFVLVYALGSSLSWRRLLLDLTLAGVVLVAVSLPWTLAYDLTAAIAAFASLRLTTDGRAGARHNAIGRSYPAGLARAATAETEAAGARLGRTAGSNRVDEGSVRPRWRALTGRWPARRSSRWRPLAVAGVLGGALDTRAATGDLRITVILCSAGRSRRRRVQRRRRHLPLLLPATMARRWLRSRHRGGARHGELTRVDGAPCCFLCPPAHRRVAGVRGVGSSPDARTWAVGGP
jgi:4-amino-4-deoxy-L-arabinose transferase-like glycosyltransferase